MCKTRTLRLWIGRLSAFPGDLHRPGDSLNIEEGFPNSGVLHPSTQKTAHVPAPVPQGHDHGGPSIMERFKRMAPPSFKGESDPLLAENWMSRSRRSSGRLGVLRMTRSAWPPICYRRGPMCGGPRYSVPELRTVLSRLLGTSS
ncbi:hypothetical protein Taro_051387 [Colocasia esculenta]|uniref:Uncharacterized protein n=1 Tax=Colocasia esculenta TaxID=4460 RepID=A0A843XGE8_COLES|nr:hypothetical protein [Colocasia esculenta]